MNKLRFYNVNIDYISELKKVDRKIPDISYDANDKFLVGIIFKIAGMNYYAPMSSFNKPQATNFVIRNNQNKNIASIRFSFMFPIPDNKVEIKDIKREANIKYRRLLIEELEYINKHAEKIKRKAKVVYDKVLIDEDDFFIRNCCSYRLLEEKIKLIEYSHIDKRYLNGYPFFRDKLSTAKGKADDHNKDLDVKENKSNDLYR